MRYLIILLLSFSLNAQVTEVDVTYEDDSTIELLYGSEKIDYIVLDKPKPFNLNHTEVKEIAGDKMKLYRTYLIREFQSDTTFDLDFWISQTQVIVLLEKNVQSEGKGLLRTN